MAKEVKILSLDGGGTKGIFHLYFLQQLENELKLPTRKLFNVIGGNSAGGIIALILANKLGPVNKYQVFEEFFSIDRMISTGLLNEFVDIFNYPNETFSPTFVLNNLFDDLRTFFNGIVTFNLATTLVAINQFATGVYELINLLTNLLNGEFDRSSKYAKYFPLAPKFSVERHKNFLKKIFQNRTMGCELTKDGRIADKRNCTPCAAMGYDIKNNQCLLFRSWQKIYQQYSAAIVAQATSAAPILFSGFSFKEKETSGTTKDRFFVDGLFCANDPSYVIYKTVKKECTQLGFDKDSAYTIFSIALNAPFMNPANEFADAGGLAVLPHIPDFLMYANSATHYYYNGFINKNKKSFSNNQSVSVPRANSMVEYIYDSLGVLQGSVEMFFMGNFKIYRLIPDIKMAIDSTDENDKVESKKLAQLFYNNSQLFKQFKATL